jgi:diguanylate cyclase (GGDEF)-like protein
MKSTALLLIYLAGMILAASAGNDTEALRRKLAHASGAERGEVARELAAALTLRGEAEQDRHDHKAARSTFDEARGILAKHGAVPSARLLKGAGLSELVLGDHDRALEFLLRAEATAEQGGDRDIASASSYLIGYVHRDLQNYELALKYFTAAYESAKALGNRRRVIMALNEIGNVHLFSKKFAAALPYKETSLKLAREHGEPDLLANGLHDMGEFHRLQGKPEKALPLLREALAIDRRIGHVRGTIISLFTIADCLHALGRYPEALAALEEARPMAEQTGQDRDLSQILLLTAQIHEKTREFPRALDNYRRYHDLWAQLFDKEKTRQTVEMQTRYEVEKKQRENELLRRDKEIAALAAAKQRSQRNFLFFVALLVLLLAAVLYYNFRAKARANRWLEEANQRIGAQQGKLEKAYRRMEELARQDQLTGLPNRRAAMEEIEHEEKRFRRSQKPFTLVMADLVGFKAVNDSLGHDAGDFVLKAAAALFSATLRAQDTVARWGGDEFLFLLPETDAKGACVLCRAIGEKIAGHDFAFNGRHLNVAVSLGTASFRADVTIEECLREADQAMYRSRGVAACAAPDAAEG